MQINLTAIVKSFPEKTKEMKTILLELVEGSTKEAACLQYDLHQSEDEPNVFIFHEIWKDAEGLAQHGSTPHIARFIEKSASLLAEPLIVYKTTKIK